MPRPPTNNRKPWTDAQNAKLQNLVSNNKSVDEIARELGRTLGSIKTQQRKLAKEKQKREEESSSRQKKKAKHAKDAVQQQKSTKTTIWIKQEQTTTTIDDDDDTHTSHARKLQPSQPRRKLSSVFSSGLRIPKKKEPVAPNDDAEGHLHSLIYATGPSTLPTSSARIVPTTPSTSSNNARRYRSSSCGRTLKPSPAGRSLQAKTGSLADDGYSRMVQQKQFCNSLSPMHHTKLSGRFVDTHKAEGLKSTPTTLMSSDPVKRKPLIVVTGLKSAQKQEFDVFLDTFKGKVETVSHWTPKYYRAMLSGIWLVCFDWVSASLKSGKLLNEQEFQLVGGAHKSRVLKRVQPTFRLFDDLAVVISPDWRNSSDCRLVSELMKMGGAQMVPSLDDLDRSRDTLRTKSVFIYDKDNRHLTLPQQDRCKRFGASAIGNGDVFHCICNYERIASSSTMPRLRSRSEAPSHYSSSHDHGRRRDHNVSSSNVRCRDMQHEREQDVDRKATSRAVAPPRAPDEDVDFDRRSISKSVVRPSHGRDERNSSRYRSRSVAPDRENRTVHRGDPEKLYVGWLHPRFNDQVLRKYFEETFGAVQNVEVKYDNRGASKGFAYVTFENPSNVHMVINGSRDAPLYIDGVRVCVDWAKDERRNECSRARPHRRDSHFSQESGSRRNRKRSIEDDYPACGPDMKRRKR